MADWQVLTAGLGALHAQLGTASQRVMTTIRQAMSRRLNSAVAYVRERYLTGGTTTDRLAVRSGRLRAAFTAEVLTAGQDVTGRIGYLYETPPGVAVHEGWPDNRSSTTIRPRRAQYLAIPLTEEARRGAPRSFGGTFVQTSRRGNLLIFQKTGGGTIQPLYLLRQEVTVPARPALRPTMAQFLPLIVEDIRIAVMQNVQGR